MKKIKFFAVLSVFLACISLLTSSAQSVTQSFLIDLGAAPATTLSSWTTLSGSTTGSSTSLKNTQGVVTPYVITVTDGFIGVNQAGLTTSSLYPSSATRDSFYLSPYAPTGASADTVGQLQLSNLNNDATYSIKFFASRSATDSVNRTARYTVGSQSVTLSANNNTTNVVEISNIAPVNGTITIDITLVGAYGYIGVLDITEFGGTVNPPVNQAPTVNAGSDISVTLPQSAITLSGTASDSDGSIVSTVWTQTAGTPLTISSPNTTSTAITDLVAGTYTFTLTATDDDGAVATDSVRVTIADPAVNVAPVTNAGSNKTITLPTTSTTINGSATDSDGSIVSYAWSFVSGPATPSFTSANAAQTTVTGLITVGTYTLRLTATDDDGAVDTDDMTVIVNPVPSTCPAKKLVAIGSSTTAGTGASPTSNGWVWRYRTYFDSFNTANDVINQGVSGTTTYAGMPTGFVPPAGRPTPNTTKNITAALAQNPHGIFINYPSNDTASNFTIEEQQFNIKTMVQLAANAGVPVWVTTTQPRNLNEAQRQQQMVMRDWILNTYGPNALDFWTGVANPDGTINATYSAGDGIHVNNAGHELFMNRVIEKDVYNIICNNLASYNLLPYANAGSDQTVQLPDNSVTLVGSATDADGMVASYQWSLVSGPNVPAIETPNNSQSSVSGLVQGTYQFKLSVTDNEGSVGTDTVYISVLGQSGTIPNLIARYTFDAQDIIWDLSTKEVRDSVGGHNGDASLNFSSADVRSGKTGNALSFGSNRLINLGQTMSFAPANEYTVSLWGLVPSVGTNGTFMSQALSSSNRSLQIMNLSNYLQVVVGGTTINTRKSLLPGQWNHIVITHKNNSNTIYLNGVTVTTATSGTQISTGTDVLIGARHNGSNSPTSIGHALPTGSSVDDVRVYNRALTASEVQKLWMLTE